MSGFPWYDSPWLATYVRAKAWIARTHPARLAEFEERLAPLRTDPAFEVKSIPRLFDEDRLQKIRNTIRDLKPAQLELHEARQFGRFIVHDHPYFTELQRGLVEAVGESLNRITADGDTAMPLEFTGTYQKDKWSRAGVTPFALVSPILVDADRDHRRFARSRRLRPQKQ